MAQPLLPSLVQTSDPFGDKVSKFLQCLAKLNHIHLKVHVLKIIILKSKGVINSKFTSDFESDYF